MSRPKKFRQVCHLPPSNEFVAQGRDASECVRLAIDEYECIRLIDYMRFSQEECAEHMQVSRATVQLIYDSARGKIATAIVNGTGIRIEGGAFRFGKCNRVACNCSRRGEMVAPVEK